MIYISGIKGNMAQRYRAVLESLGVSCCGHDVGENIDISLIDKCSGIIVASPTNQHILDLARFLPFKKPILCEKPISKDIEQLLSFDCEYEDVLRKYVTMVNQYFYLPKKEAINDITKYDYFKTGGDGLAWDCINIIGLAEDSQKVFLNNKSPVWKCSMNGVKHNLGDMDYAYVLMIMDWLSNPKSNWDYALTAHLRVRDKIRKDLNGN